MRFLFTTFSLYSFLLLSAQNTVKNQPFMQDYEGTMNGKIPIQMHLVNWGDGMIGGDYLYKKVGKKIDIYGDFTTSDAFTLKEYTNDKQTGTFAGKFTTANKITGTWSNPEGTKKLPFEVTAMKRAADNSGWSGVWYLNDVWDGGTLLVGNVRKDSVGFALNVYRSGHLGEIEGTAARQGNQAKFVATVVETDEKEKCQITFNLKGNQVEIEQVSSGWACGFGMRAHASGTFENKKIEKKASLKYGTEEVFATKVQHDGFKTLVGQKIYELFAYNMQGFENQEQELGDGFKATVVVGAVAGLYMSNEAIILYDAKGKYWAATIDFDKDNNNLIRYFTNEEKWKKKLPSTIDKWRERFVDYKIIYSN